MKDNINPSHYKSHPSGVECIEITEHMDFCFGNAFKYAWRAGQKGSAVEDLRKAVWYLERAKPTRSIRGISKVTLRAKMFMVSRFETDLLKRELLTAIWRMTLTRGDFLLNKTVALGIADKMIENALSKPEGGA